MIYDTLTNSHLYYGISARLQKALDFLVNSDFSTIPDGRYEIDGNDVFANISHGMTVQNTDVYKRQEQHHMHQAQKSE